MAASFAKFLACSLTAARCASACTQLSADRITAADLARTHAEFASLAPDTQIALAPRFGARRDFSAGEIARLARAARLSIATPNGVCFERAGRSRTRAEIEAALPIPAHWSVEILADQYGGRLTPEGRLVFERAALPRTAPFDIAIWKGQIVDAAGGSHPYWIRVHIVAEQQILRARRAFRPGEIPAPDQLDVATVRRFPTLEESPLSLAQVAHRRLRRAVPAGGALHLTDFALPRPVERGDLVEVQMEAAQLRAEAESPGRAGELVLLKNPLTGKRFQARVTGVKTALMVEPRRTPEKEH